MYHAGQRLPSQGTTRLPLRPHMVAAYPHLFSEITRKGTTGLLLTGITASHFSIQLLFYKISPKKRKINNLLIRWTVPALRFLQKYIMLIAFYPFSPKGPFVWTCERSWLSDALQRRQHTVGFVAKAGDVKGT